MFGDAYQSDDDIAEPVDLLIPVLFVDGLGELSELFHDFAHLNVRVPRLEVAIKHPLLDFFDNFRHCSCRFNSFISDSRFGFFSFIIWIVSS